MRANEKEREKEGEKVQQVKLSDSVFPRVEDLQGTVKNPPASGGEDSKPRKLIDDSDTSRRRERHRRETTLPSKFNYSRPSPSSRMSWDVGYRRYLPKIR